MFAHWNIASSKQWFDHRINVSDVLDSDIYRKIYNLISFILTWYSNLCEEKHEWHSNDIRNFPLGYYFIE